MIKGIFTQNANIGESFEPKYTFALTKEHASQLYRVLRETHLKPADWLSKVITEELQKIGFPAELPEAETVPEQLTIGDQIGKPKPTTPANNGG